MHETYNLTDSNTSMPNVIGSFALHKEVDPPEPEPSKDDGKGAQDGGGSSGGTLPSDYSGGEG